MSSLTIPPGLPGPVQTGAVLPASGPPAANETAKARDAAQQFEALLLAQVLRGVRESGGGLGKTEESGDCATDFAEQQFARVLAQQGGLGLAALVASGLEKKPPNP